MDKLCSLLFELSNVDRLKILLKLQSEEFRMSKIAQKLELSVQETSRHLSRLGDSKMISKEPDGNYRITPYGQLSIELISGLEFISNNQEYFMHHKLLQIPESFVKRAGALRKCSYTDDVMLAFHKTEIIIQEAERYVWIMSNQILMSTLPFLEEALKRKVELKLILPEDLIPPAGFKPLPQMGELIKRRTLKKIDTIIISSEKEARIAFPTIENKMDQIGFGTKDKDSLNWCKDLFQYYWEKALPGRPRSYSST